MYLEMSTSKGLLGNVHSEISTFECPLEEIYLCFNRDREREGKESGMRNRVPTFEILIAVQQMKRVCANIDEIGGRAQRTYVSVRHWCVLILLHSFALGLPTFKDFAKCRTRSEQAHDIAKIGTPANRPFVSACRVGTCFCCLTAGSTRI